jgi:hypothetical protein
VHVATEEVIVGVESEETDTCRVGECAMPVEVYSVDALTGRIQE